MSKQSPSSEAFLLQRSAAAKRYGIGLSKLDELIAARKLPHVRIGRSIRILRDSADRYFNSLDQTKK